MLTSMMSLYKNEITFSSIMPFGKYKGQTFQKILDEDIDYLVWLFTKTEFLHKNNVSESLIQEVRNA